MRIIRNFFKLFPFIRNKKEVIKNDKSFIDEKHLYFNLFQNSTVGLYQTTPEGKIISVNPAILKMLKFDSLDDIMKRDLSKGSYVDETKKIVFNNLLEKEGEATNFISQWYTKDREIITVKEGAKALKDKNGNTYLYVGVVEDITALVKTEQDLVKAKLKAEESDRLKTAFLLNMSHEIRTPLNGISGFAQLFLEPDLSMEEKEQYVNIILGSGQRLMNTVNDIMDIAKINSGQMSLDLSETNINTLLIEILELQRIDSNKKGLGINLYNQLTHKDSSFITDKNKLNTILNNIIGNAVKFTEEGEINIYVEIDQNEIVFQIKDTGIGIPKNRLNAIFNSFEQADIMDKKAFQGSGLGLSIAKAYIEKLEGRIWLESEVDKGSSFYFTIPYQKRISTSKKKNISIKPLHKNKENLKILIAEDDDVSYQYLSTILKKTDYEILHCKTGKKCIELCHKNRDLDIILMDIKMPEMTGHEATRKIREFNKDVFIIAQTAYALPKDKDLAIEAGCNDYISKPIDKDLLFKLIDEYIQDH